MNGAAGTAAALSDAPGCCTRMPRRLACCWRVDPVGMGGAVLRSLPGPALDAWVARLRAWPAAPPRPGGACP